METLCNVTAYKIESAVFLYCRFSLFLKDLFSRLFRGRNSCVVSHGVGKTSFRTSIQCWFYNRILVLREYCVLTESRILLTPVLGGVRIVALSVSSHEQTQ